jgi:mono/diheme cytochrome c family protein
MRYAYLTLIFAAVLVVSIFGFRGQTFTKPPRDVFPEWAFPGMKYQPKYKNQGESTFFADRRSDRPLPAGVVAFQSGVDVLPVREDDHLFKGQTKAGAWAPGFPASLTVDEKFLNRGRDRYSIYCTPCHGALGDGQGITKLYGMGATPSYHIDRLRQMTEGELYNTLTHGKGNMLSYADKLTPQDRWAVIAYVRSLQRAQLGRASEISAEQIKQLDAK